MIARCDKAYKERVISTLLILQGKSTTLLKKLDEALLLGNNAFPKKIPEAVSMMLKEESSSSRPRPRLEDDDAGKESDSTAAVNNVFVDPPDEAADLNVDTPIEDLEGVSEAEGYDGENARIVTTLLFNTNYDKDDYFDDDDDSIDLDNEPDNTDALVCAVQTTNTSKKAISKLASPIATGTNRSANRSNSNLVTPIDGEAKLEDDESTDRASEINGGGTKKDLDVD